MDKLPSTMQAIYDTIEAYTQAHGYAPSIRDIAVACHVGKTTVVYYLDKLEAYGYLTRDFGQARSVRLTTSARVKF